MSLFRALLLAFALLVTAPALSQTGAQTGDSSWLHRGSDIAPDPAWRFGTLPNGVRYAIRRNPLPAGQVSIRMRIDVGALHETDAEQGWAHFIEHMAFRGTASFADREARHIWQQLGASFGSDTNATTTASQTVYQLDLPRSDRGSLDTSLHVLADMASAALFDPDTVDAERRIVLAEKERQPELSRRLGDLSRPLFYQGLRIAGRNVIGTEATLAAADAEGLRAFYRRWYRPERTTIVMVGDADPAMMEQLIRARFGGWTPSGPAPADPDLGRIAQGPPRVGAIAHDGAPTTISLMWLRPHDPQPHTSARERLALADMLAARIVNRRLEAAARDQAAYIDSRIGIGRAREAADTTSLAIVAQPGRWREALDQSFAILRDSTRAPPSAAEIDREIRNLRGSVAAAVAAEATTLSQRRADQLVGAIDDRNVITTAATVSAILEANAPAMTPARIGAAMQGLFAGAGPHLLFLGPQPIESAALSAGLAAAQAIAPATRRAERRVSLDDLPAPGPPGRELSRERIEDLGVTIVRFANGSTLTFKPTRFEEGEVDVQLRFGGGIAAMPADRPSLGWLGGLIGPSGIAGFDLDAIERMMTGRRINLAFAIEEDSFSLSGSTSRDELGDQLRLLTAKLAHPRWDEGLFARFRTGALESYGLNFSSAAARGSREFAGLSHPGDPRFQPAGREAIEAASVPAMRDYFAPLLAAGPVHAVIVGDVTLDAAVEAARRTVGSLPPRPAAVPGGRDIAPPAPDPAPRRFTHEGAPDQAYAAIGWSTLGGNGRLRERRALSLAANIFRVRLFERLREAEGATYAPAGGHLSSDAFPAWGIFYAAAELRPGSADAFFRAAREIVADMATRPVAADEFARAQNPVISGIERRLATNGYWSGVLGDFAVRPEAAADVRSYLADYRALTSEAVRAAVAAYVAEAGDWSMLVTPSRAPPAPASAARP
jgi:zinc protease